MSAEQGFADHPLAAQDITEIWEFIAGDNPLAAFSSDDEKGHPDLAFLPRIENGVSDRRRRAEIDATIYRQDEAD